MSTKVLPTRLQNPIRLIAANGEFLECISETRLSRLEKLGMLRRVNRMKNGKARSATLWARPGENILTSQGPKAYSYLERFEVHRVWKLMRISEKDRPVFQTSITDNLVFVDPVTGVKRQAA